jgi:hypothetical protein
MTRQAVTRLKKAFPAEIRIISNCNAPAILPANATEQKTTTTPLTPIRNA